VIRRRRVVRTAGDAAAVVATLVAVVGTVLAVVVLVLGRFPDDPEVTAAVAGAGVVGAVAWPWARRLVGTPVARFVRGRTPAPEDVLRSFGPHADRDSSIDDQLVQVAEALVRTMSADRVEVWRSAPDAFVRSAAVPAASAVRLPIDDEARRVLRTGGVVGPAWCETWWPSLRAEVAADPAADLRLVPATHAGEVLAVVVLRRSAGADRFSPDDDRTLADLGSRLGLVLHNRELDATLQDTLADLRRTNDELRASRIRLVATADAERRRLERDLHDGAQQHLVALAVDLRLAAEEIAADPTVATGRFAALGDSVREAIAELRSLAHGIYPPLLMDQGLVEALRVSARRSPSPVTVETDGAVRHGPEVEAAAYFCCMEALQNAAKHAPGAAVRVRVSGGEAELRAVVDDDGPGFDPAAVRTGQGLANMADRVGAAGGRLSIGRSDLGGTRIEIVIPVAGP
jgi:signal transduction histidine kinase